MKLLKQMTEPELKEYFNKLARVIETALPPGPSSSGKCLFALLVTDDCGPGISQYVSNIDRSSIVKMFREAADRLEKQEDKSR